MHVIAAKAVCFKEAMEPSFKAYQAQVVKNAQAMADTFLARARTVSGGTDNHLFLLDLIDKDVTGKAADAALGEAHITVQERRAEDPRSLVTSGLHSPAVTRRGSERRTASPHGVDVRHHRRAGGEGRSGSMIAEVRGRCALCARHPVYQATARRRSPVWRCIAHSARPTTPRSSTPVS